ncbi:hypothetical protein H8N01_26265 [Streptomyces sp. AC536]|uniref:hypothetical protein n=1 Tax=Streptomyces buecherae TaxID=2763006 RepID=UPI00164EC6BF|nr:hypothetical protein [Streptomyces buecherae]MBC3985988.1 hypothetical protein [Streptomyces buecherae]QNJ40530.1 hypothetical protein H7H31_12245 [Streptomyces buecherae]
MIVTPTDAEILRAVRRVHDLERRHEELRARLESMDEARGPEDVAEQNRCGEAMAATAETLLIESVYALEEIGLSLAARAVEVTAAAEGITLPRVAAHRERAAASPEPSVPPAGRRRSGVRRVARRLPGVR